MTSFASFDLPAPVVQHLTDTGITAPFPIQSATLPDTLQGRDVLGQDRSTQPFGPQRAERRPALHPLARKSD